MLDYKREYERWLASDALNADEKAELQAIARKNQLLKAKSQRQYDFSGLAQLYI